MAMPKVTLDMLKRFHPLDMIDDQHLNKLIDKSLIQRFSDKQRIFQPPRIASLHYFLIDGEVNINYGGKTRSVSATDLHARKALESKLPMDAKAWARSACYILQLNKELVDQLLTWSHSSDYGVVDISEDQTDNSEQGDWSDRLMSSSLLHNLDARQIHEFFSALKDQAMSQGQRLVSRGQKGDCFYIIKTGEVRVEIEKGFNIQLGPGDYFGEEALVSDSVRSANIDVLSDGELCRLELSDFQRLLLPALVRPAQAEQWHALSEGSAQVIDVRLPMEFRVMHQPEAINIPITHLRRRIRSLDPNGHYLICSSGERRSELATYLLRQHGFDAYLANFDEQVHSTRQISA